MSELISKERIALRRGRPAGDVKRHTLERLDSFIDAIVGKRLTYERLIAPVEVQA